MGESDILQYFVQSCHTAKEALREVAISQIVSQHHLSRGNHLLTYKLHGNLPGDP